MAFGIDVEWWAYRAHLNRRVARPTQRPGHVQRAGPETRFLRHHLRGVRISKNPS